MWAVALEVYVPKQITKTSDGGFVVTGKEGNGPYAMKLKLKEILKIKPTFKQK